MNERKTKIIMDLRQFLFSKRDLWNKANEAARETDSQKDIFYLDGVKDVYDVFSMMIDNFEEDPEQEEAGFFIMNIINHSSRCVFDLRTTRKKTEGPDSKPGALREGMLYAWFDILNYAREIRSNINDEYFKNKKEDSKN